MSRLFTVALVVALLALPGVASPALGAMPTCGGLKATRVGTAGNDLIRGTKRRDVIVARGGHDQVVGRGGDDVICGGDGRDTISGGSGADRIYGQGANDTLSGGGAFDRLAGGSGRDACYAGAGGATTSGCEDADLSVTLTTAIVVPDGFPVAFTWRVTNVGAKASSPFDLELDVQLGGVFCGLDDPSGTTHFGSLLPGAHVAFMWTYEACHVQGADPHLDVSVQVEPDGPDAHPSNDDASVRIDVTP